MSPLIIAHRGFSSRYTENTIPAIQGAIELGVDFVEIDVHETRDEQLVVFHDYRLTRLCGVASRVRDLTLAKIKTIQPAIPSLHEVLGICRGKTKVLIEIKHADPRKVAATITASRMSNEVIVFSLSVSRMRQMACVAPCIPRFALVARSLPRQLTFDLQGIGASRQLIRGRRDVEQIHRRGWKLFVWTVNRQQDMERLAKWGVDGIITDYPDRAKSCLARR